jgi:hypothetical protein
MARADRGILHLHVAGLVLVAHREHRPHRPFLVHGGHGRGDYAKVTVLALAIVVGPNSVITFVEQVRGPSARHLLMVGHLHPPRS